MRRAPDISATDLASCVLPVPAGPSTRIGFPSRSARYTIPGDAFVGEIVDLAEPLPDLLDGLESVGLVSHAGSLRADLTARSIR